jgi:UDP-N-acetylglucosamine--N-acetylmuramyl-(pentapeptide) pyrophosphoryl-undecaprenol N-acetylglucosamine transferase
MTGHIRQQKVALVMAGGTGGHIFPGLAVAKGLTDAGWRVHWLGSKSGMEWSIVGPLGIPFEAIEFSGFRGKGLRQQLLAPWRLLQASWQAWKVLRALRPDVLVGLGGYITVPAGLVSKLTGTPLILHEQNSVAGLANKVLARGAKAVFTAFPSVLPNAAWIGNPIREAFVGLPTPTQRFSGRSGPLRVVVVGGSLGANALNQVVPAAMALLAAEQRPVLLHQGGRAHQESLAANYREAGVKAQVTAFIDNTATAFADADLVICRAGASTVTELAAIGAAALFVPFPSAVDDHQTTNARFLSESGAGWLIQQRDLTPQALASFVKSLGRPQLLEAAVRAYQLKKLGAVKEIVCAANTITS